MKAILEFDLTDMTDLALYNAASAGMADAGAAEASKNKSDMDEDASVKAADRDASADEAAAQKKAEEAAAKQKAEAAAAAAKQKAEAAAAAAKQKAEAAAKRKAEAEEAAAKQKAEEDALDDDLDLDEEPSALTKEDVRVALKKFAADNTKSDALKILKDAGAASMSELTEDMFPAVMKAIADFTPAD